jgi:hypothetical protein
VAHNGFFKVHASDETRVNILSFLEVEKIYPIKYKPFKGFMLHLPDRDILFQKKEKGTWQALQKRKRYRLLKPTLRGK